MISSDFVWIVKTSQEDELQKLAALMAGKEGGGSSHVSNILSPKIVDEVLFLHSNPLLEESPALHERPF